MAGTAEGRHPCWVPALRSVLLVELSGSALDGARDEGLEERIAEELAAIREAMGNGA